MNERLIHGDAAHLADSLVVPETEPLDGLSREAPGFAAVLQYRKHAALVNLALESLWYVGGVEEAISQRAEGF